MTAKLTQERFEKQVYEIWGDSLDLSQAVYENCSHKMWIRCKEHDIWFEQNYEKLVRRKQCGCPECATLQLEQLAHTVFADRNCHFEGFDGCTEWFWYSHEILEFIENSC